MTRTETEEEIRVTVPEDGWCRYCTLVDEEDGTPLPVVAHEHVWKKPKRCPETLSADSWTPSERLQCERDAGHDSGPFPRRAWDHGLDNVGRWILEPTPHVASWS